MQVVMLKEGMERTGEYIGKLLKAKEDGVIDVNVKIPTASDILLELIKGAKATTNGYVIVEGIIFIKGQDYELEPNEIDLAVNELRRLRDTYIRPNSIVFFDGSRNDYGKIEVIINNQIKGLLNKEANDNSYIYDGKLKGIK